MRGVGEFPYGEWPHFADGETITINKDGKDYTYEYFYDDVDDKEYWNYTGSASEHPTIFYVDWNLPDNYNTQKVGTVIKYTICAEDTDGNYYESDEYQAKVTPQERCIIGGLEYYLNKDNTAMLYYWDSNIRSATSITIPSTVTFDDGTTHTVTIIDYDALWGLENCKSVTVPATVNTIGETALGYYYDEAQDATAKVAGFTIFGRTGTAAQNYAIANGFAFRDLEAEDAQEWNGTLSGAIPAAKSVKAKAAKKSVKVSWKKATKKNLKKFDKVEIQVCTDKSFQRVNTKRVEVKKSKKSATVKGLVKGKTYYVRVRDVKGSGMGKVVSKWSKVKKVKIKK